MPSQEQKEQKAAYLESLRAEAEARCTRLVSEFRSKAWTPDEISAAIIGLDKHAVPWRNELLYMLSVCDGQPLSVIYAAVGVTGKQVMTLRRKDDEVAAAVRDYQGAYFEDEAMLPRRDIRPQVVALALTNQAHGWNVESLAAMTPEKMQMFCRVVLDAVRSHVTDTETQKKIGEAIRAGFARTAGEAK